MTDNHQTPSRHPSVVVITAAGGYPYVMINALAGVFPNLTVIREQPESKGAFIRRRAKRLGWIVALGQLATMIVSRFGKRFTERRGQEILRDYGVTNDLSAGIPVIDVGSVNDPRIQGIIERIQPKVVFTISCRILSRRTLAAIACPIINFHAGINPTYRGQMGGYWSLVERDNSNFGATVHLVDAGVDTGLSLYERRLTPSAKDTMMTYPLLLTAGSTDIAIQAVDDALTDNLKPYAPKGPSVLRYNPPIWTWLWHGVTKGIW